MHAQIGSGAVPYAGTARRGDGVLAASSSVDRQPASAAPRATQQQQPTRSTANACGSARLARRLAPTPAGARAARRGVAVAAAAAEKEKWVPVQRTLPEEDRLTIGIVGFGLFGQFLARRMVLAGHRVLATSRADYSKEAAEMGVEYFMDQYDFCEQHPDIVILVTSILSTETVLAKLPLASLKRSTCIVDVLSVKVFPKQLLLAKLPEHFDIVCTHPMFGVNSGGASWKGLNFQYEVVRVSKDARDGDNRMARVQQFLKFFADEQCNMVDMTCEDHDFLSASSQFITHTVGRTLGTMHLQPTPIDTKGYQALLELVRQTNTDSFDLYYGLFLYNQNATDELERLERGLERVKKSLLSKLHDIAREEMFPSSMIKKSDEPLKLID